jgi:hypothetical protein
VDGIVSKPEDLRKRTTRHSSQGCSSDDLAGVAFDLGNTLAEKPKRVKYLNCADLVPSLSFALHHMREEPFDFTEFPKGLDMLASLALTTCNKESVGI